MNEQTEPLTGAAMIRMKRYALGVFADLTDHYRADVPLLLDEIARLKSDVLSLQQQLLEKILTEQRT